MLPLDAIEAVASCSSPDTINQRMVTCFIVSCNGDEEFFWFCDQMEKLVENPQCVEALRNGSLKYKYFRMTNARISTSFASHVYTVCTYVYVKAHSCVASYIIHGWQL